MSLISDLLWIAQARLKLVYLRLEKAYLTWRVNVARRDKAATDVIELNELLNISRFLRNQYENLLKAHSSIVMDTPEDKKLHEDSIEVFTSVLSLYDTLVQPHQKEES